MIKTIVQYKGKDYKVQINPDIVTRGGLSGYGTTVHIWTDDGLRGYQGPWSVRKVKAVIASAEEK
jgi:hypothetical protein